jgi:hypothetical protein
MELQDVKKVYAKTQNNPIARSPKLTAGDYAIQKTNDNYNVIAEVETKGKLIWKPIEKDAINSLPVGCRTLLFNQVLSHKTGRQVTASVNLEFTDVALKTNLLMQVDEKGYTNIDVTKPLSAKEVKAFTAETIPA